MCSRFRNSALALVLVAALCSCDREERQTRGKPLGETVPAASPDTIFPGQGKLPPLDPRAAAYEGNAPAIAEGQRLFSWMNCSGCHAHGGGAIGPPLMDAKWIYGSQPEQIFATIVEGRPNGMPAFHGKLPDYQVWQLAAYVRSMSGQVPKHAAPSRDDDIQMKTPENSVKTQPPNNSTLPKSAEGPQ
jgi:cytochrome c oxidase cbb3-type subunit III